LELKGELEREYQRLRLVEAQRRALEEREEPLNALGAYTA
jgi:hypothetical protein